MKLKLRTHVISRRELVLGGIALAIVVALTAEGLVRGVQRDFGRISTDIRAKERTLVQLKRTMQQRRDIEERYVGVTGRYAHHADTEALLGLINTLAQRHKVNILNVKPAAVKAEGAYQRQAIKIEAQDDVGIFARFVFALTREAQHVGVERLQITAQDPDAVPQIRLSLSAVTF